MPTVTYMLELTEEELWALIIMVKAHTQASALEPVRRILTEKLKKLKDGK